MQTDSLFKQGFLSISLIISSLSKDHFLQFHIALLSHCPCFDGSFTDYFYIQLLSSLIDKPFLRIKHSNFLLYPDFLYTLYASDQVGVTPIPGQMAVANESYKNKTRLTLNLYIQGTVKSQHNYTGGQWSLHIWSDWNVPTGVSNFTLLTSGGTSINMLWGKWGKENMGEVWKWAKPLKIAISRLKSANLVWF